MQGIGTDCRRSRIKVSYFVNDGNLCGSRGVVGSVVIRPIVFEALVLRMGCGHAGERQVLSTP